MEWLDEMARPLLGLVTRDMLVKHLTERQVKRLVSIRRLIPVRPGVYRLPGTVTTWEQSQLAAQLHLGDPAFGGLRSAARLWGIPGVPALRHEFVTATATYSKAPGVLTHTTTLLLPEHVTTIGPHRLTTPARTLADLSAVVPADRLGRIVDECDRHGLAKPDDVQRIREQIRARGRRRTTVIDEVLESRLDGVGPGDSDLVARALGWIRSARLPAPETQVWVVVRGRRYCLDIAWRTCKVCVECDGYENHRMRHRFDSDRDKLAELGLGGWLAIPMTSTTARADLVRRVRDALQQRNPAASAHPDPTFQASGPLWRT